MFEDPVFIFTGDTDWVPDYCIRHYVDSLNNWDITPTIFVTNESLEIDRLKKDRLIEIGLHPNFKPGSTHGADVNQVVDHVLELYPEARSFRAHGYVDSFDIVNRFWEKGVVYDSNLCLQLQPNITPLRLYTGGIRFPIFWGDNIHWLFGGNWNFESYRERFFCPGLKIISIHPLAHVYNLNSEASLRLLNRRLLERDDDPIEELRIEGSGTATFIDELIAEIKQRGSHIATMDDLIHMHEAGLLEK